VKASLYFNYGSRSLVRGGQRTVLAVFCVAVGVMAIVALQLVGQMVNLALTADVRDANGGDVSASSILKPFTKSDLAFFDRLKQQGLISAYTPLIEQSASTSLTNSLVGESFTLEIIDPQTFPVVTPPTFTQPANGSIASLVAGNNVVVTQAFADQYHKRVGDTLTIYTRAPNRTGLSFRVQIAGIIANTGIATQGASIMYLAAATFQAAAPNLPLLYMAVDISTNGDQSRAAQAAKAIQGQFYGVSTQTVADALNSREQQVDFIRKFLEIAGLLALLIGGVGIVNTMQVLLSRRRTEIAMLKTTGYRRRDLYLLFGLEAGLLGLLGGLLGSVAGIGVSVLVRSLFIRAFGLNMPLTFDPLIVSGGLLIGLCTALIFGLMPIVQAANIRPLSVLRDLPEGWRVGSYALTAGLLLLLSLLFCLLAIVILNNAVLLGIGVVYGTFIFLGFLSIFFAIVAFIISILPVPERFNGGFLLLIVVMLVISGLVYLVLPTFGLLLGLFSLVGLVSVLLPRTWKINLRMALRNIGRHRARTTTTMLSLFVGVFTIGLILILGQDIGEQLNNALASDLSFNLLVTASDEQAQQLLTQMNTIPGLQRQSHILSTSCFPQAINGTPIQRLLPSNSGNQITSAEVLAFLGGLEGYDLAHGELPGNGGFDQLSGNFAIVAGRNLNASDAGSEHVLIPNALLQRDLLDGKINVGSTITFVSSDGKVVRTVTVVGIYEGRSGSVIAPAELVRALSVGGQAETTFYMKIDPQQMNKAITRMGQIAGSISVVNLANLGSLIDQILGNIILMLTALASLSLFAGVIIIANAVALAMLERRRELGILKALGYTSRSLLSEVLIENASVAGTGAFLALLLVALLIGLLGLLVFKTALGVSPLIVLALIVGVALLAMAVAALVAWGAVRVRPLEVLRYE
jgi:putative ABC transport system permease protein